MTTALLDHPAADSSPDRHARNAFPIGARFPRRTGRTAPSAAVIAAVPAPARARLFPVGARFPRRTAVDELILLGETSFAAAVPPARVLYPVGARFPRRQG